MAVVIRMKRSGRRNRPCYRISVADGRAPRDGRTLENLGVYDPASSKEELRLTLNTERARHWVDQGALPSETVRSIFKRLGVYEGKAPPAKRDRSGRKRDTKTAARRVEHQQKMAEAKLERSATRKAARAEARRAAKAAEAGA